MEELTKDQIIEALAEQVMVACGGHTPTIEDLAEYVTQHKSGEIQLVNAYDYCNRVNPNA